MRQFKIIILCGVVAGLIILISALGMIPIVGNQMNEVLESRLLPPLSIGAMTYFAVMSIVLGVVMMWTYAFVESNYKYKMKVAIIVSIVIWFLTYFWSNAALVAYGFIPFKLAAIGTAWGLLELILASMAGSKLYYKLKYR